MGSPEKRRLTPGRGSHHKKELNIVLMRSVGKLRSFKISTRFVLLLFLFLATYLPASVLIINAYFSLRFDNQQLVRGLHTLEGRLDKTSKDLQISRQHLALLKTFIADIEKNKTEPAGSETEEPEGGGEPPRTVESSLAVENHKEKKTDVSVVDVQEMVINPAEFKISVDFKLINTKPGQDAVKGYTHIMMMADSMNIPVEWTCPGEELKNGVPVNYRQGLPFSIERFKPYTLEFPIKPGQPAPAMVKVLIYNRSGVIILDKEFGLNHDT